MGNAIKVKDLAIKAKAAARRMAVLSAQQKDAALGAMAEALEENIAAILDANRVDIEHAQARGIRGALLDRLTLDADRIAGMAEGLREVASLADPVGETIRMWRRPNGLEVGQVRVPLGVVGMIYEARPNVTVDAAGLCLKAGNAVILRGGSEAIRSNKAICRVISDAAVRSGLPDGAVQLIERTDREAAEEMMRQNGLIDVLIPRGGPGLIKAVLQHATVPVIETGAGNCHVYIDESANLVDAEAIVINAKTQRPGVCNAVETLLVHAGVASEFLPVLSKALIAQGVCLRGCELTRHVLPDIERATDDDWATEYLDLTLAVRVVGSVEQAIDHIAEYGTGHSEAIVTSDYQRARQFTQAVDAAAVYVNASTRFTDGQQFGFGAEIGISTQKLHARGPMGLADLTTIKYVVLGEGQIRD